MTDLLTHIKDLNAETQKWVDAAPGRCAGLLVEDLDHWHEYGIYTVEQFDRYMLESAIWDLYKEVNGIRPRHVAFSEMSMDELKEFADNLERQGVEQAKIREAEEQEDIRAFEAKLDDLITSGASDRETAIRWLREAENDDQVLHDDGYFEYLNGLPYGYLKNPRMIVTVEMP